MKWLAIKDKKSSRLSVQGREERNIHIKEMMDRKEEITSVVIKTFDNRNEAIRYCDSINDINNLIKKI